MTDTINQSIHTFYKNRLKHYLENLGLSGSLCSEVTGLFYLQEYQKSELFARAGLISPNVGFVVSGLFYMYVIKEDGNVFTKSFIQNDRFLLASFEPGSESTVFIEALQKSFVLEADYQNILKLYTRYPALGELARKGMEKRLSLLLNRSRFLATTEASVRYAAFRDEYGALEDVIPQYIIASYLGISPTQLSRIRKKMK